MRRGPSPRRPRRSTRSAGGRPSARSRSRPAPPGWQRQSGGVRVFAWPPSCHPRVRAPKEEWRRGLCLSGIPVSDQPEFPLRGPNGRAAMTKTSQITISAESKPGVLARISEVLADAGVNITGLCAGESAGRGKVRLLVSDPARAKQALAAAKIRSAEEPALVLPLEDRPGALAAVASRLAAAKINVKCAYATTAGTGGTANAVIVVA